MTTEQDRAESITLADLERTGPIRTAAVAAGAASLKMSVGICGDRGQTIIRQVLTAAIAGARAERKLRGPA